MSSLLVSVRSAEEATAALAGGADLIDIKEPTRGSLGRADDHVLLSVADLVAGHRPISAALGELSELSALPPPAFLRRASFVKYGLAGCATRDWLADLDRQRTRLADIAPDCRLAVAAYADFERAKAPPPSAVCEFVLRQKLGALLVDTWHKDGTHLLDWLSIAVLADLCRHCREAGIDIALAGSLNTSMIQRLRYLRPAWFAVRAAACCAGHRTGAIDEQNVRALKALLQHAQTAPTCLS